MTTIKRGICGIFAFAAVLPAIMAILAVLLGVRECPLCLALIALYLCPVAAAGYAPVFLLFLHVSNLSDETTIVSSVLAGMFADVVIFAQTAKPLFVHIGLQAADQPIGYAGVFVLGMASGVVFGIIAICLRLARALTAGFHTPTAGSHT